MRRIVLPSWVVKFSGLILAFVILLGAVMVFDYWYVMNQIGENKQLKLENRRLRQQVQTFQNKVSTVENTMERMKTFATRLRVIMHLEDQGPQLQVSLSHSIAPSVPSETTPDQPTSTAASTSEPQDSLDPEKMELRKEYAALDQKLSALSRDAFLTEEILQDEYEILYDKKAFLAALPTRQPASGYFTSGFGVRVSPYGDRVKMHEGVDIANRIGTPVRAPADGEVIFEASKAGYGETLILSHGYGIETLYGHLKGFTVKKGAKVKRGEKIALVGNSGRSTGPHVHYEVRVHGYPVDPLSYIFEGSNP